MFFFFNDTATTEIYTLSLHDALPISFSTLAINSVLRLYRPCLKSDKRPPSARDRKSTRLNSSHQIISYAVFCLKKKNTVELFSRRPEPSSLMLQHHTHLSSLDILPTS